jgi:protein-L-isoaspartate(D-aspartate) O-methyltransferase
MFESDYREQREILVEGLRNKGISDERILQALLKIPRHRFIDGNYDPVDAYEDKPLEIGQGQTISQPFTVAYQTQLLDLEPGDKVLEIGTGSGYQSAVLAEVGAQVFTIERQQKLYNSTKQKLTELGYKNVNMFYGDGNLGIPEHAPYDKVLITAAAPEIPKILLQQMREGGIMVVPINGNIQRMKRVVKLPDDDIHIEERGFFHFVPMLPGIVMDKI